MDDMGCTPFRLAAEGGHALVLNELVTTAAQQQQQQRQHQQQQGQSGPTPSALAAVDGVNRSSPDGVTPLLAACAGRNMGCVLILLASRLPDLNLALPDGNTALHIAAREGLPVTVAFLLLAGVDTRRRNGRGQTALDIATLHRHEATIQVPSAPCAWAILCGQCSCCVLLPGRRCRCCVLQSPSIWFCLWHHGNSREGKLSVYAHPHKPLGPAVTRLAPQVLSATAQQLRAASEVLQQTPGVPENVAGGGNWLGGAGASGPLNWDGFSAALSRIWHSTKAIRSVTNTAAAAAAAAAAATPPTASAIQD